jgi:hypothetical protein
MADFCKLVEAMHHDEIDAIVGYGDLYRALEELEKTMTPEDLKTRGWVIENIKRNFKNVLREEAIHRDLILEPLHTVCNPDWMKNK